MSDADLRSTTLPDGRTLYTRPEREGPASLDLPVPGALGAVLAPMYRAHLGDALDAVARHDQRTDAEGYVRGEMFNRRCERSEAQDEATAAPTHGTRTAA